MKYRMKPVSATIRTSSYFAIYFIQNLIFSKEGSIVSFASIFMKKKSPNKAESLEDALCIDLFFS